MLGGNTPKMAGRGSPCFVKGQCSGARSLPGKERGPAVTDRRYRLRGWVCGLAPALDAGRPRKQGPRYEFFRLCAHDACVDCTLPQVKALTSKTRSKRAAGLR